MLYTGLPESCADAVSTKWQIILENFDKSINKLCFFHTLRDPWNFFPVNIVHFLQQIATASLQKAFTNANPQDTQALYAAGRWDLCSSF